MEWLKRLGHHLASSRPGTWLYLNVFPRIDVPLLRLTRGWLSLSIGQPIVLLETRGAKTGRVRATPLMCFPDGPDIVLIASNGGRPRSPAWYWNLRKDPVARITLRGRRETMSAREAVGDEREELWRRAVDFYLGFEKYRERAGGRTIPVVVLSPA